jgi:hypothetical protein
VVTKAGDYLAAASLKDANLRMTKRQQGADLLGQRDQASTCTKGKAKVDTLAVKDGGWRLAVGGWRLAVFQVGDIVSVMPSIYPETYLHLTYLIYDSNSKELKMTIEKTAPSNG